MISFIVSLDVHFPESNCGVLSANIQLDPAAPLIISNSCCVSRPTVFPRDIASMALTRWTPFMMLSTSFNLLVSSGERSIEEVF
jgi:hypothetical protein